MKLLEHTAECDNAYQTYKECVCHVAQAKILIDAHVKICRENICECASFTDLILCPFCISEQALKEIGYESNTS